jgi:hypothetical protein
MSARDRTLLCLLVLLGASFTGTASAQGKGGGEGSRQLDRDAPYRALQRAYDATDSHLAASAYSDNAIYATIRTGGITLHGRSAIEQNFAPFLGAARQGGRHLTLAFRFAERTTRGGCAFDVGFYRLGVAGSDANASAGKFVTVVCVDPDGVSRFRVDAYGEASLHDFGEAPIALQP